LLSVEEAGRRILEAIEPAPTETVALEASAGRVLRQAVVAERDQPPFDRVMMDGIAIAYADFAGGRRKFHLQATQAAGDERLALEPGSTYDYPRNTLDDPHRHEAVVPHYIDRVYGETQGGGTQVLVLAGVPFGKLDLPDVPERSFASISETIQHTVYKGMIAPLVLLGGLMFVTRRALDRGKDEEETDS